MGSPPEVFLQYESGTVQAVPREKDLSYISKVIVPNHLMEHKMEGK